MSVNALAFVMYPVSDLPRATAFYRDVVGLKQEGLASEAWVEFDLAGACFGIGNFPQCGTPGTAQALAIEVADMGAFRARLKEQGVDSFEPHETPVCFISGFKDPDGNSVIIHTSKH